MQPFENNNTQYTVTYYAIEPKNKYSFPWPSHTFYDTFPESFAQIPIEIRPPDDAILAENYDLVILAYQIWFLTPSIPINSFLKSEFSEQLLNGKNVVTVIGCRNMWAKAQQKVKKLVQNVGGHIVGNVAFVDRHLNHISVVTIAYWMMGGKKNRKWGVFPKPGVAERDIQSANRFGSLIENALRQDDFNSLQNQIKQLGGVKVHDFILFMDETANKMFAKWAKFILNEKGDRKSKVIGFKIYLLVAIWLISPIVYVLFLLTYPLRIKTIKKKRLLYCGI